MGRKFKAKADILCPDRIIDLKTTGNIDDFKWSARKYGYDSQCYIYQSLFGACTSQAKTSSSVAGIKLNGPLRSTTSSSELMPHTTLKPFI